MLGVRRTDGSGWEIVRTTRAGAALHDGLRALALDPATAREILTYSPGRGSDVYDLALRRDADSEYWLQRYSWAYDEPAGCWRPPDEPITEPAGTAPRAERIEVVFGLPNTGCLPITLSAAGRTDTVSVSAVFDPFQGIVDWLAEVAAGRHPRLTIDLEGNFVSFHVWPAGGTDVRFAVERIDQTDLWTLDVHIERRCLVTNLYAALIAFWEGPDLAAAWAGWIFDAEWREACPAPYPLRAPALDAFITG